MCRRRNTWGLLLCRAAAGGSRRLTSVEHAHLLIDIHLSRLLHSARSVRWLRCAQVRHGWLFARLLTGLRRRLLAFGLLVCWRRSASLCSAQVDVGKGSRCTTCQLRSDRGCTWSRRCETMVTISSLARRRLFAIVWLLTNRRLLSDTSQLLKGLRNRIKILLRLFLLLLLLLVRRGHVENVVTNVELEVGTRISWFRAG